MRDQLLGYLLGALDDSEHEQVCSELDRNPALQRDLEVLRSRLEPLESARKDYGAPVGLAERTCAFVAQQVESHKVAPAQASMSPAAVSELSGRKFRWSWSDVVVAAGVFLASAMLFFPAIAKSRFDSQVAMCQHNLQQLGLALQNYSEKDPGHRLPYVPATGNEAFAGYVTVALRESDLLPDTDVLLCPASEFAQRRLVVYVPTISEITRASGTALKQLQQSAGGSFGFNVGFVTNDGRHCSPVDERRPTFAVISDAPSLHLPNGRTENHGGRGQNVWFEDGHIEFVKGCPGGMCSDHPFRNNLGVMEAGIDENDAVIAPSFRPPFVQYISNGR